MAVAYQPQTTTPTGGTETSPDETTARSGAGAGIIAHPPGGSLFDAGGSGRIIAVEFGLALRTDRNPNVPGLLQPLLALEEMIAAHADAAEPTKHDAQRGRLRLVGVETAPLDLSRHRVSQLCNPRVTQLCSTRSAAGEGEAKSHQGEQERSHHRYHSHGVPSGLRPSGCTSLE